MRHSAEIQRRHVMRSTAYIPSERWSRIDGGMDSTEKHGEALSVSDQIRWALFRHLIMHRSSSFHTAGLNCLRQCNLVPEGDGMKTWRKIQPDIDAADDSSGSICLMTLAMVVNLMMHMAACTESHMVSICVPHRPGTRRRPSLLQVATCGGVCFAGAAGT